MHISIEIYIQILLMYIMLATINVYSIISESTMSWSEQYNCAFFHTSTLLFITSLAFNKAMLHQLPCRRPLALISDQASSNKIPRIL